MKQVFITLWRNIRRWLPGAVISIVALVAVFRLARWDDLVLAFTLIQPVNLSIAILIIFISLGTRAMAWRVLLEYKTSVQKSFFVICEGYFLNNILPLRAGEFGRAIFM
ncbi:MAG: flippase-like domain-containing protein, partial [Planctomycetes bacterium]|nr:flippase-like domain-containing protein [Planctomycetota bacterium]